MTLEKLLNKLIEKGWKPRGKENVVSIEKLPKGIRVRQEENMRYGTNPSGTVTGTPYSLNDLCSIESGLWQFVCENKLYGNGPELLGNICFNYIDGKVDTIRFYSEVNFRLMLSSIQEDKEKFLLSNIKI